MKEAFWKSIPSVRKNSPLAHNVTNHVIMKITAVVSTICGEIDPEKAAASIRNKIEKAV